MSVYRVEEEDAAERTLMTRDSSKKSNRSLHGLSSESDDEWELVQWGTRPLARDEKPNGEGDKRKRLQKKKAVHAHHSGN